jgi:hypothetical protein
VARAVLSNAAHIEHRGVSPLLPYLVQPFGADSRKLSRHVLLLLQLVFEL